MMRQIIASVVSRRGVTALEAQTSGFARCLSTSRNVAAAHSSTDQKAVSTPDQGDIGRGTHEDVVPNEVIPDEHSSTPAVVSEAGGLDTATGFKKEQGVGQAPLASATTAKPGQVEKEAQSSPTPSLAPSDKMAQPHKAPLHTSGLAHARSAFNQTRRFASWQLGTRFLHGSISQAKEDLGDREEKDMPAAGIATGGPSKGSSNIKDAGPEKKADGKLSGEKSHVNEDISTKDAAKGSSTGVSGSNDQAKPTKSGQSTPQGGKGTTI